MRPKIHSHNSIMKKGFLQKTHSLLREHEKPSSAKQIPLQYAYYEYKDVILICNKHHNINIHFDRSDGMSTIIYYKPILFRFHILSFLFLLVDKKRETRFSRFSRKLFQQQEVRKFNKRSEPLTASILHIATLVFLNLTAFNKSDSMKAVRYTSENQTYKGDI